MSAAAAWTSGSASCSASGVSSGGLSSSASPLEVSEQAADVALWSRGEATGASEGVDKVSDDAQARTSLSAGESINGVNPGVESAETKQEPCWSLQLKKR